jgi:hypothetical protein
MPRGGITYKITMCNGSHLKQRNFNARLLAALTDGAGCKERGILRAF